MIRAFVAVVLFFAASTANAQTMAQAKETAAQAIEQLEAKWRGDKASVTFRELNTISPQVWASADKLMILRLQNIWISVALRDKDVPREIGGRLLALLLTYTVDGAVSEDVAWANLALGQAYLKNPDDLRDGAHYALINAIAVGEALERGGKGSDEVTQARARAYALLGQSMLQSERPGAALFYLRRSQALADAAGFSKANRDGLATLLASADEALRQRPSPRESLQCSALAVRDEAILGECANFGDVLWSRGDVAAVERHFVELTSETRCGSLPEEQVEALRSLHYARLLLYGPDSDNLSFSVCALAGRLSGEGIPAWAAIIAWPLIHSQMQRDVYEQRIADVSMHAARRFLRENNNSLAWLALEAAMAYVYSWEMATDNPADLVKLRRKLQQPAIAYDMAYLAEQNEWLALRDLYLRVGQQTVTRTQVSEIESVYDALAFYFDENYGFKVPTPVAAMELLARIARKLPASHEHHRTTVAVWPRLEQLYRSDEARAAKVAAENLALYRKEPDADRGTIAMLLQAYADTIGSVEPDNAMAARREALEIVSALPGRESARIDLLMEVERDRRTAGDAIGAALYFDEAVAVRRKAEGVDARTAARVDMRLAVRMFNEGDRTGARKLAEAAFKSVLAETTGAGKEWARYSAAKTLADILAADGDLKGARALFEEYVFPATDRAIAAGEAVAIETRLDLASLEALHGPSSGTVKTIRDLMNIAQRRAATAKDIQERGWRLLAIAHLGLGDGPEALDAARRAFAMKPALTSQVADDQADRRLSETFVAAAWRATGPRSAAP